MRWPCRNVWAMSGRLKVMRSGLPGSKGHCLLETLAEFAAKWLAADQLLIAADGNRGLCRRRRLAGLRQVVVVRRIAGVNIDDLHVEIGIGAGGRNFQIHQNRTKNRDVMIQHIGLVHQHVGTRGGEALIFGHVGTQNAHGNAADVRNWFVGVGQVLVKRGLRGLLPGEFAVGVEIDVGGFGCDGSGSPSRG